MTIETDRPHSQSLRRRARWLSPVLVLGLAVGLRFSFAEIRDSSSAQPSPVDRSGSARLTADDRAAIRRAELLEREVIRCLDSGSAVERCADDSRYRSTNLRFARHAEGTAMFYNPAGRYARRVELNIAQNAIWVYAYTPRRIWQLRAGGPLSERLCGFPSSATAAEFDVCGAGFAWPLDS